MHYFQPSAVTNEPGVDDRQREHQPRRDELRIGPVDTVVETVIRKNAKNTQRRGKRHGDRPSGDLNVEFSDHIQR